MRLRSPLLRRLLQSQPVIAQDSHRLPEALRREGVDLQEADMALRERGREDAKEVKLAVLELDGVVPVIPRRQSRRSSGRPAPSAISAARARL